MSRKTVCLVDQCQDMTIVVDAGKRHPDEILLTGPYFTFGINEDASMDLCEFLAAWLTERGKLDD